MKNSVSVNDRKGNLFPANYVKYIHWQIALLQ